tara:strand:+ start:512 stop:760 length:249 start_codon:yes stop_codon:yes gene_type:complete
MDYDFMTFLSLIIAILSIFAYVSKRDKEIKAKGAEIAILKQQVNDIKQDLRVIDTRLEDKIDSIGSKLDDLQKQIIDILKSK